MSPNHCCQYCWVLLAGHLAGWYVSVASVLLVVLVLFVLLLFAAPLGLSMLLWGLAHAASGRLVFAMLFALVLLVFLASVVLVVFKFDTSYTSAKNYFKQPLVLTRVPTGQIVSVVLLALMLLMLLGVVELVSP